VHIAVVRGEGLRAREVAPKTRSESLGPKLIVVVVVITFIIVMMLSFCDELQSPVLTTTYTKPINVQDKLRIVSIITNVSGCKPVLLLKIRERRPIAY